MEGRFEAVGGFDFGKEHLLQMAFDYEGPLSQSLIRTLLPAGAKR